MRNLCQFSTLNDTCTTKSIYLIQFWCVSNYWPSWIISNGLLSMKVKKLKNLQTKLGLKECKWSSLNVQGTEILLSHPILKLDEIPFPSIGSLG